MVVENVGKQDAEIIIRKGCKQLTINGLMDASILKVSFLPLDVAKAILQFCVTSESRISLLKQTSALGSWISQTQ